MLAWFWQQSFWTDWEAWLRDIVIVAVLITAWWIIRKRKTNRG